MIRALVAIPFLIVIVLFALSNQESQRFVLWPTDLSIVLPLSLAVLGVALVFFVAGGFLAWGSVIRLRGKLRRAERRIVTLQDQLAGERSRPESDPVLLPAIPARRELAVLPPA